MDISKQTTITIESTTNNVNATPVAAQNKKHFFMGLSSVVLALCLAIILIVSGKSTKATATENGTISLSAPEMAAAEAAPAQPTVDSFGIPVTTVKNHPVGTIGISRNAEVNLTDKQAEIVKQFDEYLSKMGKYAIVTSGKRTSESQLDIIKQRIEEMNASAKFPELEDASLEDTSVWLKAWKWLAARHVPVNAPAAIPGVRVSKHLEGKAIDFIAGNLDQLHGWLAKFKNSVEAKKADLKILSIVREPYCVHINLG